MLLSGGVDSVGGLCHDSDLINLRLSYESAFKGHRNAEVADAVTAAFCASEPT